MVHWMCVQFVTHMYSLSPWQQEPDSLTPDSRYFKKNYGLFVRHEKAAFYYFHQTEFDAG